MPRNAELEAVLQARYELETCEPSQKTERCAKLDTLITYRFRTNNFALSLGGAVVRSP
jgi:hypothetical protein